MAFRRTAEVVRSVEAARADAVRLERARDATEGLATAIRERSADSGDDWFAAGNVVVALRRVLDSLSSRDRAAAAE